MTLFGNLSLSLALLKVKYAKYMLERRNRPLPILTYPNRKLRRVAEEWQFDEKDNQEELIKILRQMNASLNAASWGHKLGLAAPQIGISKRIFIMSDKNGVDRVFINPEFRPAAQQTELAYEKCYSLSPDVTYEVQRAKYGWLSFRDINGRRQEIKVNGTEAIIVQHKVSHLDGKCANELGKEVK